MPGPNKLYQSVIPLKKDVTGVYIPERIQAINKRLSFDEWYKTIPKEKNYRRFNKKYIHYKR